MEIEKLELYAEELSEEVAQFSVEEMPHGLALASTFGTFTSGSTFTCPFTTLGTFTTASTAG